MQSGSTTTDPYAWVTQIYTNEEADFLKAVDTYKRINHRPFPSWSEILAIAQALGYRLVAAPTELPIFQRRSNGKENHG